MPTNARLTTLICCALLHPAASSAQSPQAPASTPADYSREAYVVEQSRTAWRFENDGTGRREVHTRVKVQSEAGVATWGQLVFPYNAANERVEVIRVSVTKADGTSMVAGADAVQDLTSAVQRDAPVYTDTREKHITVPALRPDETLEFIIATIVHTPLARGHFWGDHEFMKTGIVLDERFQMDVPADRQVTIRVRPDVEGVPPYEREGRRIYEWRSSRLVSEAEDKSDKKNKTAKRKSTEPERAAVRLTTFTSWEELGAWYRELERPQREPDAELRRKAAELTVGHSNDMDKLQALYEYVAANFRYVSLSFGVGRYQPHRAVDVFRNQYGDCKDKHTLLASLADSVGLRASAALIHSSLAIDPDFPSPSQFNHVITRVAIGHEEAWVDTTSEVAPFRLLSSAIRKKQALVVDPRLPARLEETPAATPMANSAIARIDATLTASGTLSAHVHLAFSGDFEMLMRMLFRHTPNPQWKTVLDAMAKRAELGSEVRNWHVTDPAAFREPFTIEYDASKPNFVTWTKKTFELEFPLAEWISVTPRSDEDDGEPLQLGPARDARYTLRVALPDSFEAHAPLAVVVKKDYGEYRAEYTISGGTFTVDRSLGLRMTELPAARRQDFAAFRRVLSGDLRQSLGLENKSVAAVAAPTDLDAEALYDAGTEAVDNHRYQDGVRLLTRVVELDPTHRAAWTNLGRGYMGLHQTDAAIEAFRKQIAINAYDRYAYNNLGYAYKTQQKYADAEAAFLKQLEIDPLNRYAHESLGRLYLEQHADDRAATEFNKAIALSPKNAMLPVRLGEAYLRLGRREEALTAFGRAVEIDPAPLTWNDIAYQLSLNRIDLDLAQRYAESAVVATAAAARTVSTDHITERDLLNVNSIGSYWDTLGWVHFAQGDAARAEKFVRAAWLLTQNAEVGDHLGQIYEKQGRRSDAMRAYALALHAERPDARTRERLTALAGSDHADALVRQYADALGRERTATVDAKPAAKGSADFFLVFENAGGSPSVESVTFVSGDEALRQCADALRRAKFEVAFPDATTTKLLRRGTLSCGGSSRASGCRMVLMLPNDAHEAQPK